MPSCVLAQSAASDCKLRLIEADDESFNVGELGHPLPQHVICERHTELETAKPIGIKLPRSSSVTEALASFRAATKARVAAAAEVNHLMAIEDAAKYDDEAEIVG